MPDLTLVVAARDQASDNFKRMGAAARQFGQDTERAARRGKSDWDRLGDSIVKKAAALGLLAKGYQFAADHIGEAIKNNAALSAELTQVERAQDGFNKALGAFLDSGEFVKGVLDAIAEKYESLGLVLDNQRYGEKVEEYRHAADEWIRINAELTEAERHHQSLSKEFGENSEQAGQLLDRVMKLTAALDAAEQKRRAAMGKAALTGQRSVGVSEADKKSADQMLKLVESLAPAQERLNAKIAEADRLHQAGAISDEKHAQVVAALRRELAKLAEETEKAAAAERARIAAYEAGIAKKRLEVADQWEQYAVDAEQRAIDERNQMREEAYQREQDQTNRRYARNLARYKDHIEQMREAEETMAEAGYAAGHAFVGALDAALAEMGNGGEMDVGNMIASLLPTLVSLGLIAAGVPAPLASLVGSAAGVLAKHAATPSRSAPSRPPPLSGSGRRYHSGTDYVDGPSYGDEVPATLQRGEAVLSRRDVARAGGRRGLERGGGDVHITALDAQSFAGYLSGRGGISYGQTLRWRRGAIGKHHRGRW